LIVAASHSHEEIVELLARNKASLDVREDRTLGTVLHFICNRGLHGALQSLLDCGADVNARDKDQATPLHLATGKGDSTGVKILLENGADVSVMVHYKELQRWDSPQSCINYSITEQRLILKVAPSTILRYTEQWVSTSQRW
jgi:ankyrin repeat protein